MAPLSAVADLLVWFSYVVKLIGRPCDSLLFTINQSIIGLLKTDDKPQPLNTIDSKIAIIKRKIMNA